MKKRLLAVLLALVMAFPLAVPALAASPFPDVDSNASYAEAVGFLKDAGIMNGDDKGNFNPDKTVTRAEMATIICNMLDETEILTTANVFTDVPTNHWANKYVAKAVELGIVGGYGNGKFGPSDTVTYEQALTMLVRFMSLEEVAVDAGGYPNGYIAVADDYGYSRNVSAKKGDYLKRWQVATIFYNATSWEA